MIRGGIDPGVKGAIVINHNGEISYYLFPLIGKVVDLKELVNIFEDITELDGDIHFVLEDVHAIYGASSSSTFTFGRIVGQIEAILSSFMIPYTQVPPKKWQTEMFQGIKEQRKPATSSVVLNKKTGRLEKKTRKGGLLTKKMAEIAAKKLFPKVNLVPKGKRVAHDGVIDALLMSEYCRRKF